MNAKWWLITWTTYGSWLPGDPRGFRTRNVKEYVPPPKRYARGSEPVYDPKQYAKRYEHAFELIDDPVVLSSAQQQVVSHSIIAEIDAVPVESAIVSVGSTHVHWLVQLDERPIRPTVGRIKAAATRSLKASGFEGKRPWSKNCHMQSKPRDREFRNAFGYIRRHVDEGCLIHIWPPYQADDLSSVS